MTVTQSSTREGSSTSRAIPRVGRVTVSTKPFGIVVSLETHEGTSVHLDLPPDVAWNLCLDLGDHVGRHREQFGLPPRVDDPETPTTRKCWKPDIDLDEINGNQEFNDDDASPSP